MTQCEVSTSRPLVKYLAPIFSYPEPCILFTTICILVRYVFFFLFLHVFAIASITFFILHVY